LYFVITISRTQCLLQRLPAVFHCPLLWAPARLALLAASNPGNSDGSGTGTDSEAAGRAPDSACQTTCRAADARVAASGSTGVVARLGDRPIPASIRVEVDNQRCPIRLAGLTVLLNQPAVVLVAACHDPKAAQPFWNLLAQGTDRARTGLHPTAV